MNHKYVQILPFAGDCTFVVCGDRVFTPAHNQPAILGPHFNRIAFPKEKFMMDSDGNASDNTRFAKEVPYSITMREDEKFQPGMLDDFEIPRYLKIFAERYCMFFLCYEIRVKARFLCRWNLSYITIRGNRHHYLINPEFYGKGDLKFNVFKGVAVEHLKKIAYNPVFKRYLEELRRHLTEDVDALTPGRTLMSLRNKRHKKIVALYNNSATRRGIEGGHGWKYTSPSVDKKKLPSPYKF